MIALSQPSGYYPAKAYVSRHGLAEVPYGYFAFVYDQICVHLFLIYLFLSFLFDIGSVLLLVQDYQPIDAFENPMLTTGSPRGFWGKKWNLQAISL